MKFTIEVEPKELSALVASLQEDQPTLEILETPESRTTRYGKTETVQTKDGIAGQVLEGFKGMKIDPALQHVREVKTTTDLKELAQLLSTNEWTTISAINGEDEKVTFVLGRVIRV